MLGGYQTISLMGDNIYQKIVKSNSKAILVGDIVIDGVRKNSVYVPVTIAGGIVTFNAYGKQYTIGADNSITAVDHAQAEIYYFASLDDVPDDLPLGSFVVVPSEIPTFNLIEMGVPAITDEETVTICDANELKKLRSALDQGCVKLIYDVIAEGATISPIVCATKSIGSAFPDGHQILVIGSMQGLGAALTIIEVNDAGIQTKYVVLITT